MCRTGHKYEQTFAVDSTHNDTWLFQVGSPFYHRLVRFMKSVTEKAPANVELLFDKLTFNDTLTMRSVPSEASLGDVDSESLIPSPLPPLL